MNIVEALQEYLAPVMGSASLSLGPWSDDAADLQTEFLAITFSGAPRPGPADRRHTIDLWYASKAGQVDMDNGKWDAYERAMEIDAYIGSTYKSSSFANIVLISGMIGPKEETTGRLSYRMVFEITY
ncbi:hypothetical protein DDSR119_14 [Pseudomonas phage DDSR119]|nr:hypothetical protein DDSR119_14 [Pseudomonas phage DDSR119]